MDRILPNLSLCPLGLMDISTVLGDVKLIWRIELMNQYARSAGMEVGILSDTLGSASTLQLRTPRGKSHG